MVTFRCPRSTTTASSTPGASTPAPAPNQDGSPSSSSTTISSPTEGSTPAPREVAVGLTMQQFRANMLEYLKAMKASGKRAITWHDEDEPGPLFDENPDPRYPGGRLYLSRPFYDGYRSLLKQNSPWPTVQEILEEFGVSREEMMTA